MPKHKVLIAVPCMDMVAAPFAQSLAVLNKGENECIVSFLMGSLIYDSRNKLALQAINLGCDYILWLDSDMTFPPDVLLKLLERAENGCDVVSGIFFRRVAPFNPVIFRLNDIDAEKPEWQDFDDYPKNELFKIGGAGCGVTLVKTELFTEIMLDGELPYNPIKGLGEDISFCLRARKNGHDIWCDSSLKCGHIGHVTVTEDVWMASR